MIRRLLTVRKSALSRLEKSDVSEDYGELVKLIRYDQMLGLFAFWYVGSFFLLLVSVFQFSVIALAGFFLSLGACSLLSFAFLRWSIKTYDVYSNS